MIQRSKVEKIIWGTLIRIFLFVGIFIIGFVSQYFFNSFIINTLGYYEPTGFFGFTLHISEPGWMFSSVFWGAIMYGIIGKRIDYIFITVVFLLTLLDFYQSENITPLMYLGLIGVLVVGNIIGYTLKQLRITFLSRNPTK